ncbi:MAG: hypothetical protein COA96_10675 [SAR86 cluster bacterium]|uniref:Ice-binding protein C-terminal domain-containing protein n=1 Tax=SAR86 cluster bacterium TaxID=2030880 RepID=A0A2A5AXD4_9GAMM|nr:MAG: hypothetical protein COA96_10675 [SAR86 cluster bacterium]
MTLPLLAVSAFAVPTLQLGIGNGIYDLATETIVAPDDIFTLYAYAKATGNKAIDVNQSHYISIALTPQTGPTPEPFGSFDFAGTTYDINNMDYGNPPFESVLEHDAGDMSSHGVFNTFFLEIEFLFSDLMITGNINTENNPEHVPDGAGNKLYYMDFAVDVSNLLPNFGLHFDLYNSHLIGGDVDVDNFAPFSHDAGTGEVSSVPEPDSFTLFALALCLLFVARRTRKNLRFKFLTI